MKKDPPGKKNPPIKKTKPSDVIPWFPDDWNPDPDIAAAFDGPLSDRKTQIIEEEKKA